MSMMLQLMEALAYSAAGFGLGWAVSWTLRDVQ